MIVTLRSAPFVVPRATPIPPPDPGPERPLPDPPVPMPPTPPVPDPPVPPGPAPTPGPIATGSG